MKPNTGLVQAEVSVPSQVYQFTHYLLRSERALSERA